MKLNLTIIVIVALIAFVVVLLNFILLNPNPSAKNKPISSFISTPEKNVADKKIRIPQQERKLDIYKPPKKEVKLEQSTQPQPERLDGFSLEGEGHSDSDILVD